MTCSVTDCDYPDSECLLEMDPFLEDDLDDGVACFLDQSKNDDSDPTLEEVTLVVSPLKIIEAYLDDQYQGEAADAARAILAEFTRLGWSLTHADL